MFKGSRPAKSTDCGSCKLCMVGNEAASFVLVPMKSFTLSVPGCSK